MLTEDITECPECGGRCFTRYGSPGWWQFNLCFDCVHFVQFGGEDMHTREETIQILYNHHGKDNLEELYEKMTGEKL